MTGGDEKVFTPSIVWLPAVNTTVLSSRDRETLPFSRSPVIFRPESRRMSPDAPPIDVNTPCNACLMSSRACWAFSAASLAMAAYSFETNPPSTSKVIVPSFPEGRCRTPPTSSLTDSSSRTGVILGRAVKVPSMRGFSSLLALMRNTSYFQFPGGTESHSIRARPFSSTEHFKSILGYVPILPWRV